MPDIYFESRKQFYILTCKITTDSKQVSFSHGVENAISGKVEHTT